MGTRRLPRHGKTGRPYAITPEKRDEFLKAVRTGVPVTHAAGHADLSVRTVMRYLQRGLSVEERLEAAQTTEDTLDPEDAYFWRLWQDVMRARASVAVRNVALLQKAAEGGYVRKEVKRRYRNEEGEMVTETEKVYADLEWRAAAKILETSFPRDFHLAKQVEIGVLEPVGIGAGVGQGVGGGTVTDTRAIESLADRLAEIAQRRRSEGDDMPELLGEVVEDEEGTTNGEGTTDGDTAGE